MSRLSDVETIRLAVKLLDEARGHVETAFIAARGFGYEGANSGNVLARIDAFLSGERGGRSAAGPVVSGQHPDEPPPSTAVAGEDMLHQPGRLSPVAPAIALLQEISDGMTRDGGDEITSGDMWLGSTLLLKIRALLREHAGAQVAPGMNSRDAGEPSEIGRDSLPLDPAQIKDSTSGHAATPTSQDDATTVSTKETSARSPGAASPEGRK